MSSTVSLIAGTVTILNGLINLSASGIKYREKIAAAVSEDRSLTTEDLEDLKNEAFDAIAEARKD